MEKYSLKTVISGICIIIVCFIVSCGKFNKPFEPNQTMHGKMDALIKTAKKMLEVNPDSAYLLAENTLYRSKFPDINNLDWFELQRVKVLALEKKSLSDSAIATMEQVLHTAQKNHDTLVIARARYYLGEDHLTHGHIYLAEKHFMEAISLFRILGDEFRMAESMTSYGSVLTEMGNLIGSQQYLLEAFEIFKNLDSINHLCANAVNIGNNYSELKNLSNALKYY